MSLVKLQKLATQPSCQPVVRVCYKQMLSYGKLESMLHRKLPPYRSLRCPQLSLQSCNQCAWCQTTCEFVCRASFCKPVRWLSSLLLPIAHYSIAAWAPTFVAPRLPNRRHVTVARRCADSAASIPTLLASRIQPSNSTNICQRLSLDSGLRLAYVGTAKTAPRRDSDRPLKEQRKKRRYEARHKCKILGQSFSASAVEHIFLEEWLELLLRQALRCLCVSSKPAR